MCSDVNQPTRASIAKPRVPSDACASGPSSMGCSARARMSLPIAGCISNPSPAYALRFAPPISTTICMSFAEIANRRLLCSVANDLGELTWEVEPDGYQRLKVPPGADVDNLLRLL